jgi:hypothetical protein
VPRLQGVHQHHEADGENAEDRHRIHAQIVVTPSSPPRAREARFVVRSGSPGLALAVREVIDVDAPLAPLPATSGRRERSEHDRRPWSISVGERVGSVGL